MALYYVALQSQTHAFLLERRMKKQGINCEITYMPRPIMHDICNMGVRFSEYELVKARAALRQSGIPGIRLFREILTANGSTFTEERI